MAKNECGKMRKVDNPYEIWVCEAIGWEWRVLKKYQTPENEAKNPYARWFVAVKSPNTFGSYDMGDTYVNDIKSCAVRVK
jgi:hypothetical protein